MDEQKDEVLPPCVCWDAGRLRLYTYEYVLLVNVFCDACSMDIIGEEIVV
jgi:hypothetical protein